MTPLLQLLAAMFLISTEAYADGLCDWYKNNMPSMYRSACGGGTGSGGGKGSDVSGGGSRKSSLSANQSQNSASLPVHPTSFGVELIGSMTRNQLRDKNVTVGLIKGFRKFGAGITTGPGNTFYGNDLVQRELGPPNIDSFNRREPHKSKIPSVGFTTAFDVTPKSFGKLNRLKLGLGARYTNVTGSLGPVLGVQFLTPYIAFGVSGSREKVSARYAAVLFGAASVTLRIPFVELEYAIMENAGGPRLSPIHLLTLSLMFSRIIIIGAVRRLEYMPNGMITQKHGGLQFVMTRSISVGYMYNYIPGAHSVATQFYL